MNIAPSRNRTALTALIALVVAGGVTYTVSAWKAPGSPPPAGNVAGPITTGSTAQTKAGSLTLGAGASMTAPRYCIGTSCITAWPSGGTSLWQQSGSNIYYNAGNVGIGLTNPTYPLHIQSPNGGTLEFAGDYSGAISNGSAWDYVGTVVKKGDYQAIFGVGGINGRTPGLSVTDGTYKSNLFLSSAGAIFDSTDKAGATSRPLFLQTNRVGVGVWSYGGTPPETPTATLHVKGDILATTNVTSPQYCIGASCITAWPSGGGTTPNLQQVTDVGYTTTRPIAVTANAVVQKDPATGHALVQVKASSAGIAGIDLETDTTNDASMLRYTNSNRTLLVYGTALDKIRLQAPNVEASAQITSPKYCIGTSCVTAWPTAACASGVGWNGSSFSCLAGGSTPSLSQVTTVGNTSQQSIFINNVAPTLALQDTDNLTGFLHVNGGIFYILKSAGSNGTGWDAGRPLYLNLSTGDLNVGGKITLTNKLISGVANPVSAQDVATKAYVDSKVGTSFGGVYSFHTNTPSMCTGPNPVTGGCSCPSGYIGFNFDTFENIGFHKLVICYRR